MGTKHLPSQSPTPELISQSSTSTTSQLSSLLRKHELKHNQHNTTTKHTCNLLCPLLSYLSTFCCRCFFRNVFFVFIFLKRQCIFCGFGYCLLFVWNFHSMIILNLLLSVHHHHHFSYYLNMLTEFSLSFKVSGFYACLAPELFLALRPSPLQHLQVRNKSYTILVLGWLFM